MPGTYGDLSAPNNLTRYLDALFTSTLQLYSKTLTDNIGNTNAFFHEVMKGELYQEAAGGTWIEEPLLYALASGAWYDGYDELTDSPVDGITATNWDWRQLATPIMYNMKEMLLNASNKVRILNLVENKIMQSEMGMQEDWSNAFLRGAGDGALATPVTNVANGAGGIEPLAKLVHFSPTTSLEVGGINQSTKTWWRNYSQTSTATTYEGFLGEMNHVFNTCALGTGGRPDLILCDQITYELYCTAHLKHYRVDAPVNDVPGYPFESKKFKGAKVVMEDKIHDVFSGLTSAATYGTMYFLNTKFFRVRYHPQRDFEMLKNEEGKAFQKPAKGDSRIAHIGWMGNTTIKNRRKHGVLGKIARTLTAA